MDIIFFIETGLDFHEDRDLLAIFCRLGQGRDNAKIFLKEHPEISDEIEKIVRANADRLLAAGKKGTVKPLDPSEIVKPAADGEDPAAASAPAAKTTGSEVDLDIMVDE